MDGQTRPIELPSPLSRSVISVNWPNIIYLFWKVSCGISSQAEFHLVSSALAVCLHAAPLGNLYVELNFDRLRVCGELPAAELYAELHFTANQLHISLTRAHHSVTSCEFRTRTVLTSSTRVCYRVFLTETARFSSSELTVEKYR